MDKELGRGNNRLEITTNIVVNKYKYGPNTVREHVDMSSRLSGFGRNKPVTFLVNEIEYITESGTTLRLSELLPAGFSFRKAIGATGSPNCGPNEVIYPEFLDLPILKTGSGVDSASGKYLERPASFFGLLHEIGHAHIRAALPEKELREREIQGFLFRSPQDQFDQAMIALQEERDASAYALRQLRSLNVRGIDLEPEIRTREELHWVIHVPLAGYELEVLEKSMVLEGKNKQKLATKRKDQLIEEIRSRDMAALVRHAVRPKIGLILEKDSRLRCTWDKIKQNFSPSSHRL